MDYSLLLIMRKKTTTKDDHLYLEIVTIIDYLSTFDYKKN